MMQLNSAVAREVRAELHRQELKPKVLAFWLNVGERKSIALSKVRAVWTMSDLELVAEGLGIDLVEMVTRCADRLKRHCVDAAKMVDDPHRTAR
jgi:hypothetical protein